MRFILISLLSALLLAAPAFADDDGGCGVVANAFNPTEAGATHDYLNLVDGSFGTSHGVDALWIAPREIVISDLQVKLDIPPVGTDVWLISINDDDGTSGDVSCTITGTATTCSSVSTAEYTVDAGNGVTVKVDSSTGTSDPAAAALMQISFCTSTPN